MIEELIGSWVREQATNEGFTVLPWAENPKFITTALFGEEIDPETVELAIKLPDLSNSKEADTKPASWSSGKKKQAAWSEPDEDEDDEDDEDDE
jgi:hypothetical protein